MIKAIDRNSSKDVCCFLFEAFRHNKRTFKFWESGLDLIAARNASFPGSAPVGYCAVRNNKIVAAILVIWDRNEEVFSLSSWASSGGSITDGYHVLRHALKAVPSCYAVRNVSAVPEVLPLMTKLGFCTVGSASIPLVFSPTALFARWRLDRRGRECSVYSSQDGLIGSFALLDPTKSLGIRRIALLLRCDVTDRARLIQLISFMKSRGYLVIMPSMKGVDYGLRSLTISRYTLMERPSATNNNINHNERSVLNFYSGTEFEVMEF